MHASILAVKNVVLDERGDATFGRPQELPVDVKTSDMPLPVRRPPLALCFQKLEADNAVPRRGGTGGGGGRRYYGAWLGHPGQDTDRR